MPKKRKPKKPRKATKTFGYCERCKRWFNIKEARPMAMGSFTAYKCPICREKERIMDTEEKDGVLSDIDAHKAADLWQRNHYR